MFAYALEPPVDAPIADAATRQEPTYFDFCAVIALASHLAIASLKKLTVFSLILISWAEITLDCEADRIFLN